MLAEVGRIRRAGRRLGLALVVCVAVVVEVLIVTDFRRFASNQPLLPGIAWATVDSTRTPAVGSPFVVLASVYRTSEGIRVAGRQEDLLYDQHGDLSLGISWDEIGSIEAGRGGFGFQELGLIRPCVQMRRMDFTVYDQTSGSLGGVSEQEIRKAFYEWFVAREEFREWPSALSYAANIRDGVTVERRVLWHWVLHDAIVFPIVLWAMATIVSTPLRTLSRARRIRRGHCPRCSYELLAQFSDGCPECGWGRER